MHLKLIRRRNPLPPDHRRLFGFPPQPQAEGHIRLRMGEDVTDVVRFNKHEMVVTLVSTGERGLVPSVFVVRKPSAESASLLDSFRHSLNHKLQKRREKRRSAKVSKRDNRADAARVAAWESSHSTPGGGTAIGRHNSAPMQPTAKEAGAPSLAGPMGRSAKADVRLQPERSPQPRDVITVKQVGRLPRSPTSPLATAERSASPLTKTSPSPRASSAVEGRQEENASTA